MISSKGNDDKDDDDNDYSSSYFDDDGGRVDDECMMIEFKTNLVNPRLVSRRFQENAHMQANVIGKKVL